MKDLNFDKNKQYGLLKIINLNNATKEQGKNTVFYVNCICNCGNTIIKRYDALLPTSSCGCRVRTLHLPKHKNYICNENLYKLWTRIRNFTNNLETNKNTKYFIDDNWYNSFDFFKKDIGEKPSEKYKFIRINKSKGYFKENCKWDNFELKDNNSDMYNIRFGMIQRCTNLNYKDYKNYGGRGITVCERWLESFENFYEDMGERPSKNHSLDRIDNNGNYCKENCRWTTDIEQQNNTRYNRIITYNGETKTLSQWSKILHFNYQYVYGQLRRTNKTFEQIIAF